MIRPKTDFPPKPNAREEGIAYELAYLRDGGVCVKCRRGNWIERDHRRNRSQGGLTTVENLQLLCHDDHLWKTTNPAAAMAEGWSVPSWADPAEWPARRWLSTGNGVLRLAWVLYTPDGRWVELSDVGAKRRMEGVT